MIGPHGGVDRQIRERVTERLAAIGEDNLLGRHLLAMEAANAAPLIAGNRVQLLVDGPHTYAAMFSAIDAAQDHVNVEMFIFDEARHAGRNLSDLLVDKASRGVAINVLFDDVGSSSTPAAVLDKLRAAGVRLCVFNPVNPTASRTLRFMQRDHRKTVVVDAHRAFVGGINFSATYSSGSRSRRANAANALTEGWRDTQIELEGPVALQVQRLFLQSWAKQKCAPPRSANYLPPPRDAGDTLLRLNASSIDSRRNETYAAALSAVTFAKRSVDLTMGYFAPDDQLEDALKGAARRGVRVRLLLPGISDFNGILHAGRAHYSQLLASGVLIFEERQILLHAKTLEIDGIWSTVGSANWDWLSFASNDELNVIVIDTAFAQQMQAVFEEDLARATPIIASAWARRPVQQRLLQRFWVTWERFL
jgi:cardiolipin synthase